MAVYANENGSIKDLSKASAKFFQTFKITSDTCDMSPAEFRSTIINNYPRWGTKTPTSTYANMENFVIPIKTIDLGCTPSYIALNFRSDDPDADATTYTNEVYTSLTATSTNTIYSFQNELISSQSWYKLKQGQSYYSNNTGYSWAMLELSGAPIQIGSGQSQYNIYPYKPGFRGVDSNAMLYTLSGNNFIISQAFQLNSSVTKSQAKSNISVYPGNDKVRVFNILTFDD